MSSALRADGDRRSSSESNKIKQISQLEFIKTRSTWIGSRDPQTIELWALKKTNIFELTKLRFAPALNKLIDEILVNCIDHWTNNPQHVKNIDICFGKDVDITDYSIDVKHDGIIQIHNDGPGIAIELSKNINGKEMYSVQMICSEFHSGNNFSDDDRITGGMNGIGMKAVNAYSNFFAIKTIDTKQIYKQTFQNRLDVINKPTLTKKTKKDATGTTVTFLPCYEALGGFDLKTTEILLKTRAYQAKAFTGCNVTYNGKAIEFQDIQNVKRCTIFMKFCHMILRGCMSQNDESESEVVHQPTYVHTTLTLTSEAKLTCQHDMTLEVCVALSDGKFRQVSILNGIYAYDGGNHITHIQGLIVDGCKPHLEKLAKKVNVKANPNLITNNLFLFVKGNVLNAEWGSNLKSKLDNPIEQFQSYIFTAKAIKEIWKLLEDTVTQQFIGKQTTKTKSRVSRSAVDVPKSVDAQLAGKKSHWHKCTLMICEGDSAQGTVREGIIKLLGYKHYGTFNIQGVPINCRKESTVISNSAEKTLAIVPKKKFQENERINSLMKILGLDLNRKYDPDTDEGNQEFQMLRYGRVVIATDADYDGLGQIAGLILNFFIFCWPGLIKRGYVCRLNTPIIRAIPKSSKSYVEEFYTIAQFNRWIQQKFDGVEANATKTYKINYFKGLGSHEKSEAVQLFKDFESKLFIYCYDPQAEQTMEIYFGTETKPRKIALSTPVTQPEPETREVNVSDQLNIDTKGFQRDNIIRKLPHLCDGLVPAKRKVICGARAIFGDKKTDKMKLATFVSDVSSKMGYHHGEASLSSTVIKMAQSAPGGRNLPMLYPRGNFGSRSMAFKDAASPRYIYTHLNYRLCYQIYPKIDDWLLEYEFDDGVRCEPKYYVPIIPMAILENMELPGTGWKVKIWARDIDEVFANVRSMIKGEITQAKQMKIWKNRNQSLIRKYKGKRYSFGKYIFDEDANQLVVTELPIGKYSCQIMKMDDTGNIPMKDEYKSKPLDETSDEEVKITFYFKPDAYKHISEKFGTNEIDCFEDYLNLKNSLSEYINVIGIDGNVLENKPGKGYQTVFNHWFKERKRLYAIRIDREYCLTKLRICMLENVIRFTQMHAELKINNNMKISQVIEILSKNKFDRFHHTLLDQPKFTPLNELSEILNGNSSTYDYLIDLKYRDMIEEACLKRADLLQQEKLYLAELEDDMGTDGDLPKGGKTWLKELNMLEETIKLGLEKGWDYGMVKPKFR